MVDATDLLGRLASIAALACAGVAEAQEPLERGSVEISRGLAASGKEVFEAALEDAAREGLSVMAVVNGEQLPDPVRVRIIDGVIYLAREDAATAGLTLPPSTEDFIAIDTASGLSVEFDRAMNLLRLTDPVRESEANVYDLAGGIDLRRVNMGLSPVPALIVNYDINGQIDRTGLSIAGMTGVRVAYDHTALGSRWRWRSGAGVDEIVRLDSTFTLDLPEHLATLSLGDFITATPDHVRPVRLAGIQLGRNFDLRPDIITYPLPDFADHVAVPQTIDIFVEDRRLLSQNLNAGSFQLRNIPLGTGRNEIGTVIRDALGRERFVSSSGYISHRLLDEGLSEWSASVGIIRHGFGFRSADYGRLMANGMWRRGVSDTLTLGLSGEATDGLVGVGAQASAIIGNLGVVNGGVRLSRSNPGVGITQTGYALTMGFESNGPKLSGHIGARLQSKKFDDLASIAGDRRDFSYVNAGVRFDTNRLGNLVLEGALDSRGWHGLEDTQRLSRKTLKVGYRNGFGRINVFGDILHQRIKGASNSTVFLGLSIPLGGRTNGNSYAALDQSGPLRGGLSVSRAASVPGEFGYGVRADLGRINRYSGEVSYRADWGGSALAGEIIDGDAAMRAEIHGSLVMTEHGAFAVENAIEGMVMVKTEGVEDVAITREFQTVTMSGRADYALVSRLPAHTVVSVGLDERTLPYNATAERLDQKVRVPGGTVWGLDLGLREYLPKLITIVDGNGRAIPMGTITTAHPSGTEYIIGTEGRMELNVALPDEWLVIENDAEQSCVAVLPAAGEVSTQLTCRAPGLPEGNLVAGWPSRRL